MPLLAQYHHTDGLIRGVWSANTVALLKGQIVTDDPEYGYLLLSDQDTQVLQEQYVVVEGQLAAKPLVTLSGFPAPFAADGTTACTVTVTPFVPCTVWVGATPYALVPEDRHLILTADAPTVFQVSLPHQAACWGAPITVEAV
jgi:hypothetical protein